MGHFFVVQYVKEVDSFRGLEIPRHLLLCALQCAAQVQGCRGSLSGLGKKTVIFFFSPDNVPAWFFEGVGDGVGLF